MTANKCKTIRREIDDAAPDQELIGAVAEHLHGCAECRTFHAERRALHGLMAGLETVGAPSDFDFRLRARLAREKSSAHGGGFALISRPIAVVAMVLVIAMAGLVIKSWLAANKTSATSSSLPGQVNGGSNTPVATPKATSTSMPASSVGTNNGTIANVGGNGNGSGGGDRKPSQEPKGTNNVVRRNSSVAVKRGGSVSRDSAISPAPVLVSDNKTDNQRDNKTAGSPVLVRLDPRALKVSVDNGRGTSRMISLPAVSFGSQRWMARESFQARGTAANGFW
jgi:hypothetical protein